LQAKVVLLRGIFDLLRLKDSVTKLILTHYALADPARQLPRKRALAGARQASHQHDHKKGIVKET